MPGLPRAGRATGASSAVPRSRRSRARRSRFADGTREPVDAIVCATGLRRSTCRTCDPDGVGGAPAPTSASTGARCTRTCPASAWSAMFPAQGPYFPLLELQARWIVGALGGRRRAAGRGARCAARSPSPPPPLEVAQRVRDGAGRRARRRARPARPARARPSRCCSGRCSRRATGSTARARAPTPPTGSARSSPRRRGRRSIRPTSRRCAASGSARRRTCMAA